ncbi:Fur family transcriptional regulator [Candidatus Nitrospira bockiana]
MKLDLDTIRRRFHERGLKLTPQRAAIYRALAETTGHPTAEALYRQVRAIHPMISQNTVYYTLGALKAAGLVHEVNYWHDRTRFDANLQPHHHLICLGCRRIEDLTDAALDRLPAVLESPAKHEFEVLGHRVEFHGYCARCRKKAAGAHGRPTGRRHHHPSSTRHPRKTGGAS